MDSLLTPEEAADCLGTNPRHLRRLVTERRIGFVKVGRWVRFRADHLDRYVQEHTVEPDGPVFRSLLEAS